MLSMDLLGEDADDVATVTGVTLEPALQELEVTFCTAEPRSQVERPLKLSYDFTSIQLFTQTLAQTITPGGPMEFTAPVVEVPVVPAYLLIKANYGNPDLRDASKSLADVCFPVDKVSMSFGSRSGLLSGMSQAQLYQISVTAGLNMCFSQWVGQPQFIAADAAIADQGGRSLARGSGGVLIVDVAASLSLPPGVVPGQAIRMSFSMEEAVFTNHTRSNVTNPQLQIIALTSGTLQNEGGASLIQTGGIPGTDSAVYEDATEHQTLEFSQMVRDGGFGGGGLGDSIRSWMKRLKPFLSKAVRAAPGIAAAINPELAAPAQAVKDLAISLGAGHGKSGRHHGGKMLGGHGGSILAGRARKR